MTGISSSMACPAAKTPLNADADLLASTQCVSNTWPSVFCTNDMNLSAFKSALLLTGSLVDLRGARAIRKELSHKS